MVKYTCSKCSKEFSQKGHYTAHASRKTLCISESEIREQVKRSVLPSTEFKVVDLFSGAGGMTVGFSDPAYRILFGVEWDKYAAQTYSANFKHPMLNEDICKLDVNQLVSTYGKADVVIGGPPCQGFSMAGKRNTNDPRNSLFMEYIRFVQAFEPKYFVMENVPGILTMKTDDGTLVIDIICAEIDKIGYNLKWKVLLACDYGVPQKRRRVIFLGYKKGLPEPEHPEPTHSKDTYVCMRDVLAPRETVPDKYYHSQKMIDGFNTRKIRNQANGKGFGAQIIRDDEPCFTISARYYKDGSDALVRYSEDKMRRLTEKEAARVQSFPETFVWPCSGVQTYKQIGNAVACKMGDAIASSLLKVLHLTKEGGI